MIFTGKNLELVRQGIELAIMEIQSQIGSCPDVYTYAKELEDLEAGKATFERLLARVERSQEREGCRTTS